MTSRLSPAARRRLVIMQAELTPKRPLRPHPAERRVIRAHRNLIFARGGAR